MGGAGKCWADFVALNCVLLFALVGRDVLVQGQDSIQAGQSLSGKRTIISAGENFELGLFNPVASHEFYLGIWYKSISNRTTVWVANRDMPLLDATSELRLLETGNLALFGNSDEEPIWSTNSTSAIPNSTIAVLLDSGNLVLRNRSNPNQVIWQSFDNPTDTWLPGGKIGLNKQTGKEISLISWITSEYPFHGAYSFGLNATGMASQLQMKWNQGLSYWNSGDWNGQGFALAPDFGSFENSFHFEYITNENESYFTYSLADGSLNKSRIVLNPSGQIMLLIWNQGRIDWELVWSSPRNPCLVPSLCGDYSSCDPYQTSQAICSCLDGFGPENEANWAIRNRTGGCIRQIPLQCGNDGSNDGFFSLSDVINLPTNPEHLVALSPQECEFACLDRCDCTAYSYNGGCLIWHGDLLNIQASGSGGGNKTDLHIRLAAAQLKDFESSGGRSKTSLLSSKQRKQVVIISGINGGVLLLLFTFLACFMVRKKRSKMKGKRTDLSLFDPSEMTPNKHGLGMKKGHNLPLFSFASVAKATENFSTANKLGQGGYGPVYKGKLLNGQEVAVKRLSATSVQGLEEFKNEVTLISELQHVNLVKLIGCCIEEEEKILIYEYMGNKSLDFFLFDSANRTPLNWGKRKQIIEGIAQGLLYLHKYSRLRIIHRDLKASNILLDDDMNPKISDFGMARIHAGSESKANTKRVVGTFGYMAPEYAVEGTFSIKSDVFSFGVLLLEIITGKRATSFRQQDHYSNILAYAWESWKGSRCWEIMDQILRNTAPQSQFVRCINVALLCVQERASDRPIMSDVIYMLGNENFALPEPKEPAYIGRIHRDPSRNRPRPSSLNHVTISDMEAR